MKTYNKYTFISFDSFAETLKFNATQSGRYTYKANLLY